MVLTGDIGKLRVGYQVAATLHRWTVTRQHPVLGLPQVDLTGVVHFSNLVWSAQPITHVGLWMGTAWWVWEDVSVEGTIDKGKGVDIVLRGNPVALASF